MAVAVLFLDTSFRIQSLDWRCDDFSVLADQSKNIYCKCRKYRTLTFYRTPPFSSTTTEFFHSRFTELCTMLLTKSITCFLIHAPFYSLFLNQSAHQSIPENLHCATYKKYYLLPRSCTSLFTYSVVEMVL